MFLGTKCVAGLHGCYGNHCTKELCNNSTTSKYFKFIFSTKYSLWHNVLMNNFIAVETLSLPWQQANCAIAQLLWEILSSYLAHKFLGTKHITCAPGCYGSTVIMATEDFAITWQIWKYFKFIFCTCIPWVKSYYRYTWFYYSVTIAMKELCNNWTTWKC